MTKFFLCILVLVSAFLHFYKIAEPTRPVFDETYYATFASDYANFEPHYDGHPPVGKFIYALPLFFHKDKKITDAEFIKIFINTDANGEKILDKERNNESFGNFPYVTLRYVSAIFGIALIALVFFLARNLTGSETVGLVAAFLTTFENALLLESRLILLNVMGLAFGIIALILFFSKKPKPIIGGIFLGLSIGVKWIAIVYLGPIIAAFLLNRDKDERRIIFKNIIKFSVVAIIAYLILHIAINTIFSPVKERLMLYESFMEWLPRNDIILSNWELHLKAFLTEMSTSLNGYTVGVPWNDTFSTHWYEWPTKWTTTFYSYHNPLIILTANPLVWLITTMAIFGILMKCLNYRKNIKKYKTHFLVLGSYALTMLPLALVSRATYFYHYFPAYIFGIILAAMLLKDFLEKQMMNKQKIYGFIVGSAIIASFLMIAPYVYGS